MWKDLSSRNHFIIPSCHVLSYSGISIYSWVKHSYSFGLLHYLKGYPPLESSLWSCSDTSVHLLQRVAPHKGSYAVACGRGHETGARQPVHCRQNVGHFPPGLEQTSQKQELKTRLLKPISNPCNFGWNLNFGCLHWTPAIANSYRLTPRSLQFWLQAFFCPCFPPKTENISYFARLSGNFLPACPLL